MTTINLPYSVFTKAYQSAGMLLAREQIMALEAGAFSSYEKKDREKAISHYRKLSKQSMETGLKDYKEVVNNLAKRMASRGR